MSSHQIGVTQNGTIQTRCKPVSPDRNRAATLVINKIKLLSKSPATGSSSSATLNGDAFKMLQTFASLPKP